jgi:hypothetical protein
LSWRTGNLAPESAPDDPGLGWIRWYGDIKALREKPDKTGLSGIVWYSLVSVAEDLLNRYTV